MSIIDKIEKYLNESTWKKGQWIVQNRKDENEYGILIDQLKNGSWSVITKSDYSVGGNATKKSTSGWYPTPKLIDEKDVPSKIKEKILKKAKQLGVNF